MLEDLFEKFEKLEKPAVVAPKSLLYVLNAEVFHLSSTLIDKFASSFAFLVFTAAILKLEESMPASHKAFRTSSTSLRREWIAVSEHEEGPRGSTSQGHVCYQC